MKKLQALMLSRAWRATSAACVICGAALLYVKSRRRQSDEFGLSASEEDMDSMSRWWPLFNWSFFNVKGGSSDGEGAQTTVKSFVFPWRSFSECEVKMVASALAPRDGKGAILPKDSNSLRELSLLTKDEKNCNKFLQLPETVENLIRLPVTHQGQMDHEVECLIAEVIANLSAHEPAKAVLRRCDVDKCIALWSQREDSARLSLLASKLQHNLCEARGSILNGYVYDLNKSATMTAEGGVDVVFVNGINGSVFHTWRPRDDVAKPKNLARPRGDYQTCWPRDWLAEDLPSARLIGVDIPIRAWSWNPASSKDTQERQLVPRSTRLLTDMERAGVGKGGRPVVWITHSMGGLLVKEMLRQADAANSPVADACRGVLFMSTPHRGTTSMRALFYFPLRLALSLESRELTMNSQPLLLLDDWFRDFAQRRGLHVVEMVESLPTRVSPVYSVVLVRPNGEDLGEIVPVPNDHITISKPLDKEDLIYTTVKSFVTRCAAS